jgi:hypothetical protein
LIICRDHAHVVGLHVSNCSGVRRASESLSILRQLCSVAFCLGPVVGRLNASLHFLTYAFDNPLYPTSAPDYLSRSSFSNSSLLFDHRPYAPDVSVIPPLFQIVPFILFIGFVTIGSLCADTS